VPALTAAATTSFTPPRAAFERPELMPAQGVTMDDASYPGYVAVFGYAAPWDIRHMTAMRTAPKSRSGYAYFHLGRVYTAEGDELAVGKITYGGQHASLEMGLLEAVQHYDDATRAVALVRAGEDEYGIWIAGVLMPGVEEQTRLALQVSPLSGDWRYVGRDLEMIAALAVNVPGFPLVQAHETNGRVTALVASAGPPDTASTVETISPAPTITVNIDRDFLEPFVQARLAEMERERHAAELAAQFAALDEQERRAKIEEQMALLRED
jgi:hypothetical protein